LLIISSAWLDPSKEMVYRNLLVDLNCHDQGHCFVR
jgi:hypothetical protein